MDAAIIARARAAYLGLAIGDALGATVEFLTPREIQVKHGVHREITGGGWLGLKAGQVTDDTTMSVALGEALLTVNAIEPQSIGRAFDGWMRAKPVDIGHTVRRGLMRFRRNGETVGPYSEHDAGNGACMRCLPIALAMFGAEDEALRLAHEAQAHLTHHNALSDGATLAVMHAVQQGLAGQPESEIFAELAKALEAVSRDFAAGTATKPEVNPSGYIVHTLRAVVQALQKTNSFEDCLIDVVNRGGDADTTGAIAGMIAGACYGELDLPDRWLQALDPAIREVCSDQAVALVASAPLAVMPLAASADA